MGSSTKIPFHLEIMPIMESILRVLTMITAGYEAKGIRYVLHSKTGIKSVHMPRQSREGGRRRGEKTGGKRDRDSIYMQRGGFLRSPDILLVGTAFICIFRGSLYPNRGHVCHLSLAI
jgi:hypothetical protein